MENLEIILVDFRKDELDKLVFDELKINPSVVKSSHFFDDNKQRVIEFHQIKSLKELLSPVGTGNVFLKPIDMGCSLNDVLVIFSFDNDTGDITFNFVESQLFDSQSSEVKAKLMKMLKFLVCLQEKYNIPKIRFGFEPATDSDTCLVEISKEKVDLERVVEQIVMSI